MKRMMAAACLALAVAAAPFRWNIGGVLRAGRNVLEVDREMVPSGLLGPVCILEARDAH